MHRVHSDTAAMCMPEATAVNCRVFSSNCPELPSVCRQILRRPPGPALGMFEVFGRIRPQNLGGRNFGTKKIRINLLAHLDDFDLLVYAANADIYAAT